MSDCVRAAPSGCYYYTFADGRPALIPSPCAAHAPADPSSLPAAPLPAAAAPAAEPLFSECFGVGPKGAAPLSPAEKTPAGFVITEEDMLAEMGETAEAEGEAEEEAAADGRGGVVSEGDMLALLARQPPAGTGTAAAADYAVAAAGRGDVRMGSLALGGRGLAALTRSPVAERVVRWCTEGGQVRR